MTTLHFGNVRWSALSALRRGCFEPDYSLAEPASAILCRWQEDSDSHIGLFCNLVSNLESLDDLLSKAKWCDDFEVPLGWAEPFSVDELLRLYGIIFLVWEQTVEDYDDLLKVGLMPRREVKAYDARAGSLKALINNVFKHRHHRSTGGWHRAHHHGPYLFDDNSANARVERDAEPTVSVERPAPGKKDYTRLVVPSLVSAMESLGRLQSITDAMLTDDDSRARVVATWGDLADGLRSGSN